MRETKVKQLSMFGTQEFPSYEKIIKGSLRWAVPL